MTRTWSRLDRVTVTPVRPLRLVVAPPPLKRPTAWWVVDVTVTRLTVDGATRRLTVDVALRRGPVGTQDAQLRFGSPAGAWMEELTQLPAPVLELLAGEPVWSGSDAGIGLQS